MRQPVASWTFRGQIAGVGSSGGTRVIVGRWQRSPLGAFADAMVERPGGERLLLAPSEQVADFVSATYRFDGVLQVPVRVVATPDAWWVDAGPLRLRLGIGRRSMIGHAARLLPRRVATAPWLTTVTDPVARVVIGGVRTRGTAGESRTEYYGAYDVRRIDWISGSFDGRDLGHLREVRPPVRFGFGSTPREPTLTWLVTTIRGSLLGQR